jgi:hypothetical protein
VRILRWIAVLLLIAAQPLPAQGRQVRAFAADSNIAIRLWVPDGLVEVRGWDSDSVDCRSTVESGARFVGGGSRSAAKFALESNQLTDHRLPSATIRVMVPRGARVWIKSTTAHVIVQGVRGEVDILQVDGRTVVRDLAGITTIESIDGSIGLDRVTGIIRVRGGAAAINLGTISGTLEVSSVSGAVGINNLGGHNQPPPPLRGRINTVGGKVTLFGGVGADGHLSIETHDGHVELNLSAVAVPRLDAQGGTMNIAAGLSNPANKQGTIVVRTYRGSINAVISVGIRIGEKQLSP